MPMTHEQRAAAQSYLLSYAHSGKTILPVWWSEHMLLRNKSSHCTFCRTKIVSTPKPTFYFNHQSSFTGDRHMPDGGYDLPICLACDDDLRSLLADIEPKDINVSKLYHQRVVKYLRELPEESFNRLNALVRSGLIPNVMAHIFNGENRNKCVICHSKGLNKRPETNHSPLTLMNDMEYMDVPVGQCSTITDKVAICKNCLEAGTIYQQEIMDEGEATETEISKDVCERCQEEYTVTIAEYNERVTLGTLGEHLCMECMSPYIGTPRIIVNGVQCQTCQEVSDVTYVRSFDLTLSSHKKLSRRYIEMGDSGLPIMTSYLCDEIGGDCRLNSKDVGNQTQIPEILRIEQIEEMNKGKGKRKSAGLKKQEKHHWEVLHRVQFIADDLPIRVQLEQITCPRFKQVWVYKHMSTMSSELHGPNTLLSNLSSAPQFCRHKDNDDRSRCQCYDTQMGANMASAHVLVDNADQIK